MKKLPFSLHNAVLEQVAEEDKKYWAKSKSYFPPPPKYRKVKIKFTPVLVASFIGNFLMGLRP